MLPAQQANGEARRRVAILRGLLQQLQQLSSKDNVAPLVAAITARDVDIHGRMLTDLGNTMRQIQSSLDSNSEHTARVREQMHRIDQDVKSLQELTQEDSQRGIDTRQDPDQLRAELAAAINQLATDTTRSRQPLQALQEAIEGLHQIISQQREIIDAFGQRIESLQCDISVVRDGLEKEPFATPVLERIAKIEEMIVRYFPRDSEDAETIKPSPSTIKTTPDHQGVLEHPINQPINDTHALGGDPTSQIEPTPKQPNLADWPAIVDFITTYERYLENYKSDKPDDDLKFIESFLDELTKVNIHASCAFQRYLLETYPKKVVLISSEVGQQSPDIFVKLVRMRWSDIRRAIAKHKDLRIFQWASNDGILGPSPAVVT
ncbi:hypothetical protein F4859DRAFT_373197 [Xylaria cf. heliscus]|nr:hypothetical protein F4859DRAFT_373197 [Xylaria cf. heliscus]